jgi:pimeloyl-ACP methyl ester carboxylesterase
VILFCHGLESVPHGSKYHALVAGGLEVVAPDCRGKDLRARVDIIVAAIAEHHPRVVVGSSFGGIAGLLAALVCARDGVSIHALLLCAPALQLPDPPGLGITRGCPAPTTIIHGTRDDIIPIELSRAFARDNGARLVEVDDEHALPGSLELIVATTHELAR